MKKTKKIILSLLLVCVISLSLSGIVSARILTRYHYLINSNGGTSTDDVQKLSNDKTGYHCLTGVSGEICSGKICNVFWRYAYERYICSH